MSATTTTTPAQPTQQKPPPPAVKQPAAPPASSTPAAPEPAKPPAPDAGTPIKQPINPLKDAFDQLDALAETEIEAQPKSRAAKAPEKTVPKAAEGDADASQEPAEAPQESKQPLPEPVPKAEGKGGHVASLREAYETTKARVKELEAKLSEPHVDPEARILKDRVSEYEQRISKLESELQESAYERSDEYKQQFEVPVINALNVAYEDIGQLTFDDGEGNQRKATKEDFNQILQMPLGQATQEAAKFGLAATVVLQHRQRIRELNNSRIERLDTARKAFAEKVQKAREIGEKYQSELNLKWKAYNDEARQKYPQWFAPEEGDDEGNKLLDSGMRFADSMFDGRRRSEEESARLHSAIRNKAGGFDRLVFRNRKLASRVKELESELDQFKQSEPPGGGAKREPEKRILTWEDELDSLAKAS